MKLGFKSIILILVLSISALIWLIRYQDAVEDKEYKAIAKRAGGTHLRIDKDAKKSFSDRFHTYLEIIPEESLVNAMPGPLLQGNQPTASPQKIQEALKTEAATSQAQPATSQTQPATPQAQPKSNTSKSYFKESIIYNNKTILYLGSEDKIASLKRVLDTISNLDNVVNKAMLTKEKSLITEVKIIENEYVLSVNGKKILTVSDIDAKLNNTNKEKLARIWNHNIGQVVAEYIKYKKPQTLKDNVVYILINLLILIIAVGIIEFIKLLFDKYVNAFITILARGCNRLVKRFKDNELANEKTSFTDEAKAKIDLISLQTCHVLDILSRIVQVIAFMFFIVILLYNVPETYPYIKEIAHYFISILVIYGFEYCKWLFSDESWKNVVDIVLIVFGTIVAVYIIKILESIIINLIQVVMCDIKAKGKRFQTITKIIGTTLQILIMFLAVVIFVYALNIDIAPLLAGAGIAGIAISFAGQNLFKDVINGVFILFEDQFGIGDEIQINDLTGVVEDMTLRITVMRDLSGVVHIISNSQITSVSVFTKKWSRANLDISISYKDDVDKAIKIIKETADQLEKDFPEKIISSPRVLGVNKLNSSSVDIKLVIDTAPGDQWFIGREYRRRIKYAFDNNNIEIPFPQMTISNACEHKNEIVDLKSENIN